MNLSEQSPPTDRLRWLDLAAKALRRTTGRPVDRSEVEELLTTTTYDGLGIRPLYTAESAGDVPYRLRTRPPAGGWQIRQHHRHAGPDRAGQIVRDDLDAGVTSVWLAVGADGLPIGELPGVLDEIDPVRHPVVLDAGDDVGEAAEILLRYAARAAGPVTAGLGADPLAHRAATGVPADEDAPTVLAARCTGSFPGVRAYTIDATVYHDAGASDAQELGCALAVAVHYLRRMTGAGLTAGEAFQQIEFRYAATADQFATIAKFRAARRLWARVGEVCGAPPSAAVQQQHAVTSSAMMTARDPWVNILRSTLACFGAGIGGADAVTLQPYDAVLGPPGELARRVARNTGSILLAECHLGRVRDPAGGSWYVEELTGELARVAWDWFAEIECQGGAVAVLESGLLAKRLAETWDRRRDDLAHRRGVITGVSDFPLPDEPRPPRAVPPPGPAGALPRHRYAEDFEELRDRADAWSDRYGQRPEVFIALLGAAAARGSRPAFVTNLFAAGGLGARTVNSTDPGRLAAAFSASGLRVACLVGPDEAYADRAEQVIRALRDAGAVTVWLAGRPDPAHGADGHVHAGCDALSVLRTTYSCLERPR
ncbi:methylmalonyl-CoA mutase subunit beta [Actinoplanes sp. NPDC048967]|uniref:methylmalonyl-CoA mutase subunit beta n=1 Tax=Actinoplanes sp. NPDC048967 TaxID=3155269 RepID=UPI0033F5C39B